jgi:hypothetical protein
MDRGEKFVIGGDGSLTHESDDAERNFDLAETVAKHGGDPETVIEQRVLLLRRRAMEALKAQLPAGTGGRPKKYLKPEELQSLMVLRGNLKLSREAFAKALKVDPDTLRRLLEHGSASEDTIGNVRRLLKKHSSPKIKLPK